MGARARPRQAIKKGDSAVNALSEVVWSLQQPPTTLPKGMYLSLCFTGDCAESCSTS